MYNVSSKRKALHSCLTDGQGRFILYINFWKRKLPPRGRVLVAPPRTLYAPLCLLIFENI